MRVITPVFPRTVSVCIASDKDRVVPNVSNWKELEEEWSSPNGGGWYQLTDTVTDMDKEDYHENLERIFQDSDSDDGEQGYEHQDHFHFNSTESFRY